MEKIELREPVVFLQIGLSRMGDKRGISSDEIEVDADKDLVKARKVIFRSKAFDKIKSLDSEIRRYVRSQSFPYESGLHMVALRMSDHIDIQLNAYHNQRYQFITEFAEAWPEIKVEFPAKLRKLYEEKDYDVGDVASNFSMSWNFIKLIVPTELSEVSEKMLKDEQKKFRDRMDEAYEEARMILRETCFSLVSHLRESLEPDNYGAAKRISSSTVTKLQEFLRTFNLRDITNDLRLQTMTHELSQLLTGVEAESLRTLPGFRDRTRTELEIIEERLQEAITIAPTRRIKGV